MYEYAIRLEMKDAFFGCHESYRFPFPPFVLHLSPVLQDAGFSGFSGLLGFEKKKKKKKEVRTVFTKGISIPPKVLCAFPEVRTRMDAINKQQTTNK